MEYGCCAESNRVPKAKNKTDRIMIFPRFFSCPILHDSGGLEPTHYPNFFSEGSKKWNQLTSLKELAFGTFKIKFRSVLQTGHPPDEQSRHMTLPQASHRSLLCTSFFTRTKLQLQQLRYSTMGHPFNVLSPIFVPNRKKHEQTLARSPTFLED